MPDADAGRPRGTGVAFVRALARAVTRTFYRVETRGAPPADGPVLFVVNHPNALLDPAVVWATAGRDVRFLAKEPLFRMPILGSLLRAGDAIPVYRASDTADTARNAEMFSAVQVALARGDAVCIFPEGTSHSTGRLEPLRTGAARIALAAAGAGVDAAIVPVGLNFERKSAFRSRAAVVYGPPLRVLPHMEHRESRAPDRTSRDPRVAAITERIADGMRALLIEADPVVDAAVVARIDRLYGSARPALLQQDRVERRRAIAEGLARLRSDDPEWYAEIAERVRTYDARRARFGLRDRDLDDAVPVRVAVRFAIREALVAVLLAPLVLAGLAIFVVPYRLTDWIAGRVPLDQQATTKVLGGVVVYGLWIGLIGWMAWRAFGVDGAALTLALLPIVAFASLFAIERETAVLAAVRGWIAVRRASPRARARLGRTRDDIAGVLDQVRQWIAAGSAARAEQTGSAARRE